MCFEFSVFHFLAFVSSLLPDKVFLKKKEPNAPSKINPSFCSSGETITTWLSRNHSYTGTGPQYCNQLTCLMSSALKSLVFKLFFLNVELRWTRTCSSSLKSLKKFSLEGKVILLYQFSITIWDTTQQLQLGMPWKSSLVKKTKLRNSSFQDPSNPQQAGGTGSMLPVNQNSRGSKPGCLARSSQSHLHSKGQRPKANKPPRRARF